MIDPDAPATLRQVAEMMRDVLIMIVTENPLVPLDIGKACHMLNTFTRAPAVAKTGDEKARAQELRDVYGVTCVQVEPTPSPDPFAPMVSAYLRVMENFTESGEPFGKILRRALAAAIENAPFTEAMRDAWVQSKFTGETVAWRVFSRALAADLRGGK